MPARTPSCTASASSQRCAPPPRAARETTFSAPRQEQQQQHRRQHAHPRKRRCRRPQRPVQQQHAAPTLKSSPACGEGCSSSESAGLAVEEEAGAHSPLLLRPRRAQRRRRCARHAPRVVHQMSKRLEKHKLTCVRPSCKAQPHGGGCRPPWQPWSPATVRLSASPMGRPCAPPWGTLDRVNMGAPLTAFPAVAGRVWLLRLAGRSSAVPPPTVPT